MKILWTINAPLVCSANNAPSPANAQPAVRFNQNWFFVYHFSPPPPPTQPPPTLRVATVQIGGDKGDIDALISTGGLSPPPANSHLLIPFNRSATSFINKLSLYNSLLCVLWTLFSKMAVVIKTSIFALSRASPYYKSNSLCCYSFWAL